MFAEAPAQPAVRPKGKSAKRNEAKRKKKEEEQLQQADGMLACQAADLRYMIRHSMHACCCRLAAITDAAFPISLHQAFGPELSWHGVAQICW